jgi:hypothetical protein
MALTKLQEKRLRVLRALQVATGREIVEISEGIHGRVNGTMRTLNLLENKNFQLDGKNWVLLKEEKLGAKFYEPNPDRFCWRLKETTNPE